MGGARMTDGMYGALTGTGITFYLSGAVFVGWYCTTVRKWEEGGFFGAVVWPAVIPLLAYCWWRERADPEAMATARLAELEKEARVRKLEMQCAKAEEELLRVIAGT